MATKFMNFDTKYPVAGSSKLKATTAGHIYNIKVSDATLHNGAIVKKGELETGSLEVYKQAAASTEFRCKVIGQAANGNYYVEVTVTNGDLLVLQTPLIYENYTTRCQHESNFVNEKNDIVRAYELYVGDVFELSVEGFTPGKPSVGDGYKVDTSTKKLIDDGE